MLTSINQPANVLGSVICDKAQKIKWIFFLKCVKLCSAVPTRLQIRIFAFCGSVAQCHSGTKWGLVKSLDWVIISVCKMFAVARWWRLGWSGWKQGAMLVEDFGDDHDVRPRLMMISPPKNMKMPMMTWNLSVQLVGGWASCSQAGSFSSKSPHQPPLDLARITRQTWPGSDFH